MRIGAALVACIAALGCGKGGDPKQCSAEAGELTRWLRTLELEPQRFTTDNIRLVSRADLPAGPIAMAPVVYIGADETTYQGQLVGAPGYLELRFAESQRMIREDLERARSADDIIDPRSLHLLVDEYAPWERVVTVIDAAHRAGFTLPSFVFTPPPQPSTRPPRSWLDDRMDALEADHAAGKAGDLRPKPSRPIAESCPAVVRLYKELGAMQHGDKAERLVSSIGPALVECRCKVDLPALRSQLWHMLHNPHPVRALEVELTADAPPLVLPARTPWREASARLSPATGSAWFAIAN